MLQKSDRQPKKRKPGGNSEKGEEGGADDDGSSQVLISLHLLGHDVTDYGSGGSHDQYRETEICP